jgi:hypothetical protein
MIIEYSGGLYVRGESSDGIASVVAYSP